jgi:hypothetical protein
MSDTPGSIQTKNPTELLRDQVTLLQNVQHSLEGIQESQVKMLESLLRLHTIDRSNLREGVGVHVENINMPFWAIVGFLIKVSIAAIPAAILISILGAVIWLFLGGIVFGLVSALQ